MVIDASASSQFVSALLLAGARYDEGVDVRHDGKPVPSLPHIDMTVAMLREHGVEVDDSTANRWAVAPGVVKPVDHVDRAGPLQRGAVPRPGRGDRRRGPGPRLAARRPPRPATRCRDVLTQLGCTVTLDDDGLTVAGPARLEGIDVDLHDHGELTPAVAAICALAAGPSHLRGVAHIRGHETDRLAALAAELGGLGADVTEHPDGLSFRPAPCTAACSTPTPTTGWRTPR